MSFSTSIQLEYAIPLHPEKNHFIQSQWFHSQFGSERLHLLQACRISSPSVVYHLCSFQDYIISQSDSVLHMWEEHFIPFRSDCVKLVTSFICLRFSGLHILSMRTELRPGPERFVLIRHIIKKGFITIIINPEVLTHYFSYISKLSILSIYSDQRIYSLCCRKLKSLYQKIIDND